MDVMVSMERSDSYVPEGRPFKYCSNCGAKIDKDAEICPKCGVRQVTSRPSGFGGNPDVTPPPTEYDFLAIHKVEVASIVGIVGILLSLISFPFLFSFFSFGAGIISGFVSYLIIIIIGAILGIISIVFYRSSFDELKNVDQRSFKTPYGLVKYFYVGLALMIAALVMIFIVIGFSSVSVNSAGAALSTLTGFFIIFVIIIVIAGIMLLIGIIGLIIGLWHIGTRYDDSLLKIGAILYIIPYADIVAPVLIFIGAHGVKDRLESGTPMKSSSSSGAVAPPSSFQKQDSATRLANLKQLFDSGQITKEDYEAKRKQILDEL